MVGKRDLVTGTALKPHDGRPIRIAGMFRGDDFPCVHTDLRSRGITPVEWYLDTVIGHHHAIDSDGRSGSQLLDQLTLLTRGAAAPFDNPIGEALVPCRRRAVVKE
jgi:hypothetical protein